MKTVHVQYFALLREQRGLDRETLVTASETPAELYRELRARHPFTLGQAQLRVAQNGEFVSWDEALANEAKLVFLPPVAGG